MRHDDPAPRQPSVTTVGRGTARAVPDAALLTLEVWAELDTPQAALDEVARRTELLQGVLDTSGVEPGARSTSGVSLTEVWDYEREERVFRGYRAATTIDVRITELTVLGTVISESTRDAQARPHGPVWQVDPTNPARTEACRLAAEDARRKAEAYAGALGLSLGAVLAVREPRGGPPDHEPPIFRAVAAQAMASGPDVPVETGDAEVQAAVHVVFELTGAGAVSATASADPA
jgi:uncharacterized protein YggE